MRAQDPDCIVLAGSVSCFWDPSSNWTESCFSNGMFESGISGWSVHPYGLKSPEAVDLFGKPFPVKASDGKVTIKLSGSPVCLKID